MTDQTQAPDLLNTALRVLVEQRTSRNLKATTFRTRFGDRLTKQLQAETEQLETEVIAIDALIEAVKDGRVF